MSEHNGKSEIPEGELYFRLMSGREEPPHSKILRALSGENSKGISSVEKILRHDPDPTFLNYAPDSEEDIRITYSEGIRALTVAHALNHIGYEPYVPSRT